MDLGFMMGVFAFLVIAILGGITVFAFVVSNWTKARMEAESAGLAYAARFLGDSNHVEGSPKVCGSYNGGRKLTFRYTVRGSGSNARNWTEIEAVLEDVPLSLELRPHTRAEDRAIKRGHAIDLQTGHEEFDAKYVVEGAPKEVIVAALDAPMCERLLRLGKSATVQTVDSTQLSFESPGWIRDPSEIQRRLELAADLGDALCEAHAKIEQATVGVGESYRGPSGAATDRAREARHDELRELHRISEERRAHDARRYRVWLFGLIGVGVLILVLWLYDTYR